MPDWSALPWQVINSLGVLTALIVGVLSYLEKRKASRDATEAKTQAAKVEAEWKVQEAIYSHARDLVNQGLSRLGVVEAQNAASQQIQMQQAEEILRLRTANHENAGKLQALVLEHDRTMHELHDAHRAEIAASETACAQRIASIEASYSIKIMALEERVRQLEERGQYLEKELAHYKTGSST